VTRSHDGSAKMSSSPGRPWGRATFIPWLRAFEPVHDDDDRDMEWSQLGWLIAGL
jgi:hypothetical protein